MRIGFGYDIHRMVEGRPLILGGVEIPYIKGLDGYSDADVLLHAVCDSILGAAGKDDIGIHFPNNAPEFKGISSVELLKRVITVVAADGYRVVNVDATIILEEPKLMLFRENMKSNISAVLGISLNSVNIKATTNEGVGAMGRGEAVAAYAVALLTREK